MYLNKKQIFFLLFLFVLGGVVSLLNNLPSKKPNSSQNNNLTIEKRVSDLISKMTLQEKVAQLLSVHPGPGRLNVNDEFLNDPEKMNDAFKNGIGMVNYISSMPLNKTIQYKI